MEESNLNYFLASNSGEGFVSCFEDNYSVWDGWRAYIIKGGPGTGKSSFMKKVASNAQAKGYNVEFCFCSSDPDSLDGVIIKDIKAIVLDGTAPHTLEPKTVGVCEEIINLGEFWDSEKLRATSKEILDVAAKNKTFHKTASAYISVAAKLMYANFNLAKGFTNYKTCENFATNLSARLLPEKRQKTAKEYTRFLAGVTPKGVVTFTDTVENFYKNIIVIDDKYGFVANMIMQKIREKSQALGYEIITLKNPFLPSKIIDHILIPELSMAFVREYEYMKFSGNHRRIHATRFCDINLLREHRSRITLNNRIVRELLITATSTLEDAKLLHDELEKYYITAMDFDALTKFIEKRAEKILNKK